MGVSPILPIENLRAFLLSQNADKLASYGGQSNAAYRKFKGIFAMAKCRLKKFGSTRLFKKFDLTFYKVGGCN